jgi:hypothetical protein
MLGCNIGNLGFATGLLTGLETRPTDPSYRSVLPIRPTVLSWRYMGIGILILRRAFKV